MKSLVRSAARAVLGLSVIGLAAWFLFVRGPLPPMPSRDTDLL